LRLCLEERVQSAVQMVLHYLNPLARAALHHQCPTRLNWMQPAGVRQLAEGLLDSGW
jgi:hypothetical protein